MNVKPIKKADFDTSVRPQDDFYRYVNGGWFKKNTIPKTESRWGSFHTLQHKNTKVLHSLLKKLLKKKSFQKGSELKKLRDLYLSSMNMRKRNQQGLMHLQEGFDIIEKPGSKAGLTAVFAYLHTRGVSAPWGLWFDQDDKNSKRMVLRISQGGLGVPDRDYLVKKDKESKRIKNSYQKHLEQTLRLEGFYQRADIPSIIKTIVYIETQLARASMTSVESRDTHALYNKRTVKELERNYPSINWGEYFDLLKVPQQAREHIIIDQLAFLAKVDALLRTIPLNKWKIYLRWHFLDTYVSTLGENFIKVNFAYRGQTIQGLKKIPELWKRSVRSTTALMGDALGKLYVEKCFPSSSKKAITKLVRNLIKAYRLRLEELDWMSQLTKQKAFHKLKTVSLQLGHPTKWLSYKKLQVDQESYVKNVLHVQQFEFEREVKKLAKPTDPKEWFIPASTVNAFYSPNLNQITFPAGILQPPFFYPNADDAINYGAIGATIGHELTHGFDDQGAHFDEKGNLKDWWTKADKRHFEKRTKKLEEQFNAYEIVDNISVNGKLTLGENIADLGGVIIAYKAFKISQKNKAAETSRVIDGFNPDERFFISHALTERCLFRDEFLKLMTLNDPHSPNEFRLNGPMSNMIEFYEVFDVKEGDALYRPLKKQVHIW